MQNIKTKVPYPCEGCPKNKGGACTDKTCRSWLAWVKDAWNTVIAEVKDAAKKQISQQKDHR